MTIETIRIELNRPEGALLRILGLIERRGFDIRELIMPHAVAGANSHLMQITVSVEARQPGRSTGNLAHQLRKLWDIEQVTLVETFDPCTNSKPMPAVTGKKETVSCAV